MRVFFRFTPVILQKEIYRNVSFFFTCHLLLDMAPRGNELTIRGKEIICFQMLMLVIYLEIVEIVEII